MKDRKGREKNGRGEAVPPPAAGRCSCGGVGGPPAADGKCICPKCGATRPLQRGVPCFKLKCPACGTPMIHLT